MTSDLIAFAGRFNIPADVAHVLPAPRRDIPFSKCLDLAPDDVRARYTTAAAAESAARWAGHDAKIWYWAVSENRMWWQCRGRSGEVDRDV